MAEIIYNNMKNASTSYTPFEFNSSFYFKVTYKKDVILCSWSKLTNKLTIKLRELIIIYRKNFQHV